MAVLEKSSYRCRESARSAYDPVGAFQSFSQLDQLAQVPGPFNSECRLGCESDACPGKTSVFPCLIFTAPWLPGEQPLRLTAGRLQTMCCRQRCLRNPECMGMGKGRQNPEMTSCGFLGFVTGKDEKQSETEGTDQDQVPESR